ncbi:MAG: RHS repeat-associated core domain-containing protein, partial [Deltaproteobacteria bacterium]
TTVVDHLTYDSFGNIVSQTNAAWQPQSAFTGQVWDSDAGLYWYHARWYDPHTGRFISQDPAGFAAGDPNLYRYVGNGPTNFIDPTGLRTADANGNYDTQTPLNGMTDKDVFVFMEINGQEPQDAWLNVLADNTVNFFTTLPRDVWLMVTHPVDSYMAYASAFGNGLMNIGIGIGNMVAGMVAMTWQTSPLYWAWQGKLPTLSKDDLASIATMGLSGFIDPIKEWTMTGDPTQFQQYAGTNFANTMLGYGMSKLTPPGEAGCGSRNICFVAGTPVLTGGRISEPIEIGAGRALDADASGVEWCLAATGVAVGLVVSDTRLLRQGKRRKRRDRAWEDIFGDDPRDADDAGDAPLEKGRHGARSTLNAAIMEREPRMPSPIVFEFTQPALRPTVDLPLSIESLKTSGERSVAAERRASRGKPWRTVRVTLALLLAVAGLARGWWIANQPDESAVPSAIAARHSSTPIEDIHVGQRVLTQGATHGTAATAVDPSTWRHLQIEATLVWDDGTRDAVNVETLQPPESVEEHHADVGATVPLPLDLLDMGLPEDLQGTVLGNLPCPEIERGPGRVVLTTVNHLNRYVLELSLRASDGRQETLRPTGFHKFFSESRGEWISADNLETGEALRGIDGPVTVAGLTRYPGVHRVYNMTVEGEHVYRVSDLGVLVHNTCPNPNGRNGSPAHQVDVAANNGPNGLKPGPVGGRVPDGIGQLGQPANIRGVNVDPGPMGRVIAESEPMTQGGLPVSAGRGQIRDIRAAAPRDTIVVTNPNNPGAAPLIYPPGTQPPPTGRLPVGTSPTVPYPD